MPGTVKAHIFLTIVAFIYGANYTIAKFLLDEQFIGPYALTLLRVVIGAVLFTITHVLFVRERIQKKDLPLLILCSITGVVINQLFFISGLKMTAHINAALIATTIPVAAFIASYFLLKERITLLKLAGVCTGLAGVVILTIHGKKFAYDSNGYLGDILIFINACSFGTFLVLVKTLMRKYHPVTVTKWIFLIGIFFVTPFGYRELMNTPMNSFTLHAWTALAYVLICTTFLAYLFNTFALKLVKASTVSIYVYLQPLIASAIALLAGKDDLTLIKVTAGILIFSGVYIVSKKTGT